MITVANATIIKSFAIEERMLSKIIIIIIIVIYITIYAFLFTSHNYEKAI